MNEFKTLKCLKSIALSNLNGDCVRIALYIAGSGKQLRLSDIEKALGMSKNNVSVYCRKLYKMGVLKLHTSTIGKGANKLTYPHYSINWDYCLHEEVSPCSIQIF